MHTNVDGLSRFPAPSKEKGKEISVEDVLYTSQLEQIPVTSAEISSYVMRI
ncbi:hypothetical protein DPMN_020815 [Dreissena polymorpha]|uniref:Uncharacterized protein n=1 Tax=Dreissena polymorpha TaxID=45954 RepID=A0A9D4NN69_DREPO|nr:hypothetical protein DPMN_020815 [Dreissena polymorpha]